MPRQDGRRPARPEARGDRRPRRPGGAGQAAVPGEDRRGLDRRPVGRARVRARRRSRSSATTSTAATRSRRPASSNADGSVSPIGGVKQKTIGARRAGVDVFLVPAGDNAKEARKYAGPVSGSSLWRVFDRRCARWQRCRRSTKNRCISAVLNRPQRARFSWTALLIHGGERPIIAVFVRRQPGRGKGDSWASAPR